MENNQLSQRQLMDDEINLLELWNILQKGKRVIILITAVFAMGSIAFAMWLPDIYRSEVLLAPSADPERGNTGGGGLGQLTGLANLAGVNIGSGTTVSSKDRALAIMRSRFFIKDFFDNHDLVVPFMGSKPGESTGSVEIDPELYDEVNQEWVRENLAPGESIPSDEEVYERFSELLQFDEDIQSGLITVSIEWYDPNQIKNWLDWLIDDLNSYLRADALLESQRAVDYLTDQLQKTSLVEMRSIFVNLIETQTQKVMLADIREDYSFEILDPAFVSENQFSPSRMIIVIVATVTGGMLSIFFVLFRHYSFKEEELV